MPGTISPPELRTKGRQQPPKGRRSGGGRYEPIKPIPAVAWRISAFPHGFAEQSGLSFPGAPWLVAAGALAASGRVSLLTPIGWATMGSPARDVIWFHAGQRSNALLFRLFPHWQSLCLGGAAKWQSSVILHGLQMLTAARFLPFSLPGPCAPELRALRDSDHALVVATGTSFVSAFVMELARGENRGGFPLDTP